MASGMAAIQADGVPEALFGLLKAFEPEEGQAEIAPGIVEGVCVTFQDVDRRSAIHRAILAASPGSVVLIAGKGHETYQLVSGEVLDFDDRLEASRALAVRRAQGQTRASD